MKIDHIGIATESIVESSDLWHGRLGLGLAEIEEVAEQGVRAALFPIGESQIELLEPLTPDSPVGRFLQKRGPGIHHVALRVDDIQAELAKLKASGVRLIDEAPRAGARGCLVAFIHPSATGGVLLELVQHQ